MPYPMPTNKTRMTFRSKSYKSKGFNEMTIEDKTGGENMSFHAQRDHTTRIENNQALTVGGNLTQEVGGSINHAVGATGAGVAGLMAPLATMAGLTLDMLGQGFSAAMSPPGQSAQNQDAHSSRADGADGLQQALSGVAGALAGGAATMASPLTDSLIGLVSQAGQQAQKNVWNGPSTRPDAGTALAAAGNLFGQGAGALCNLPGFHNHITGTAMIIAT